jgi:enoyl-CoA hydratase
MSTADHVRVDCRGRLGILTLDRPKALNALTLGMIEALEAALHDFERDDEVDAVLIRPVPGRAFCAGGDVRAMGEAPPSPELDRHRRAFFAREYALDYLIHRYPKPYLAVIDGITMGGGCGISLHGSHRIATEKTLIAMPEVAIGLFPDVGATWFLNRLPGEMGAYLALTGLRVGAADAVALGLATNHVASASVDALVGALAEADRLDTPAIDAVLRRFQTSPGTPVAAPRQRRVDALFAGETVPEIMAALAAAPEDWAAEAHATMRRASPTSLVVSLRQLRDGIGHNPVDMFRAEYRLAVRLSGAHDFREGVRAVLIDKDTPRWQPATLDGIDPAAIDALFAPLEPVEPELELD